MTVETFRAGMFLAAMAVLLSGCGLGGEEDPEPSVTVLRGVELVPYDMRDQAPVARYLSGSDAFIFLSPPRYSSTCRPSGSVDEKGGTLTLTIEDDETNCTSDAVSYTFLVQHFGEVPDEFVVVEDGSEDFRLDMIG